MRSDAARRGALVLWCVAVVLPAAVYGGMTLAEMVAIPCDLSLDRTRFCAWWEHSRTPTLLGVPGVLALGCYVTWTTLSRRPVTVAAILVVLTCAGLRLAAAPVH